jgi:hypothetical protein
MLDHIALGVLRLLGARDRLTRNHLSALLGVVEPVSGHRNSPPPSALVRPALGRLQLKPSRDRLSAAQLPAPRRLLAGQPYQRVVEAQPRRGALIRPRTPQLEQKLLGVQLAAQPQGDGLALDQGRRAGRPEPVRLLLWPARQLVPCLIEHRELPTDLTQATPRRDQQRRQCDGAHETLQGLHGGRDRAARVRVRDRPLGGWGGS